MDKITSYLPPMLFGEELNSTLSNFPIFDADIKNKDVAERLIALNDIYDFYYPTLMAREIYSKMYLAVLRSLQKKESRMATVQRNENRKIILSQMGNGIIGGSDSFTIIGKSGLGKSAAIARAISLISPHIIKIKKPYQNIIPILCIQCPSDSSIKNLLLEILRKVDEQLSTTYYASAVKTRATVDVLIGSVSQVALNHIGLLVVDEIENVVNSKNGSKLIGSLTQLINNSGISICMVGTEETSVFFEQAFMLARRSLGLQYSSLPYEEFEKIIDKLFEYQYTEGYTPLTDGLISWLYEHTSGIIAVLISLFHDAQEYAILNSFEKLNMEVLNNTYNGRLSLLCGYLGKGNTKLPIKSKNRKTAKSKPTVNPTVICVPDGNIISDCLKKSKIEQKDYFSELNKIIKIDEISIQTSLF